MLVDEFWWVLLEIIVKFLIELISWFLFIIFFGDDLLIEEFLLFVLCVCFLLDKFLDLRFSFWVKFVFLKELFLLCWLVMFDFFLLNWLLLISSLFCFSLLVFVLFIFKVCGFFLMLDWNIIVLLFKILILVKFFEFLCNLFKLFIGGIWIRLVLEFDWFLLEVLEKFVLLLKFELWVLGIILREGFLMCCFFVRLVFCCLDLRLFWSSFFIEKGLWFFINGFELWCNSLFKK